MTKTQRRFLFGIAVVFFVLISAGVLTLALGYRYDSEENRFVKTGSIVVRPNTEAQIFIDDKLEGRTSFLKSSFSKKRLLPGIYEVTIKKDGFAVWQKEVKVKEGLVSDLSKIVLFNQNQVEKEIISHPGPLFINREFRQAVYEEKGGLVFYDLEGQLVYRSGLLPLDFENLNILWGLNGREAAVFDKNNLLLFDLVEGRTRELVFLRTLYLKNAFLKNSQFYFLKPSPEQSGKKDLVVFSAQNLTAQIVSKNINSFFVNKENIFAIRGAPFQLLKLDLKGESEELLGKFEAKKLPVIKAVFMVDQTDFVLVDSDLYSFKNQELNLISKKVKRASLSPDNFMVGWQTGSEFWVGWIRDTESQPFKKSGEIELIFKTTEKINSFSWYKNSNYVFLELAKSLTTVEVDSRGTPNQYKLLSLENQEQAWYDLDQNKIFKLNRSNGLAYLEMP